MYEGGERRVWIRGRLVVVVVMVVGRRGAEGCSSGGRWLGGWEVLVVDGGCVGRAGRCSL